MPEKETILKQYFGHAAFRSGQGQVVDAILQGRDALCVMPTGAGKSACYQVPALMFSGLTLVISPLISLMKDQVHALTQNGIRAAYLNSSLSAAQYDAVLRQMQSYQIVYVAPERLAVSEFLEVCRTIKIDLLAVDEAHCISQWGQDFRPGYLKIADFVDALGYRPVIAAFTATATERVKEDIEQALHLDAPFRITTGFDRPNLKFSVLRPKKKMPALLELLRQHFAESGIIYCTTRKNVEAVAEALDAAGFSVTKYHAGLSDETRRQNQEDFVYDRKAVMVATNAFGMGIDKSNVSYVIHYNMPKDLESYYQEAGRAGRDGTPAECTLLYSPADVHTNRFLIENTADASLPNERDYERLKQMTFYATTNGCLRHFILHYFGEASADYCGNCSNCLTQFQEADVTEEAQKILSCIKRTGERFGKKMICDILRGSKNEKLLRLHLDRQTTYGLMRTNKSKQIYAILAHLEAEGYVQTRGTDYPTLALTPQARAVLFENKRVLMQQVVETAPAPRAEAVANGDLLTELKALRRTLADAKGIPAYMVFSNAALLDMCKKQPATPEEFLSVSGVGKVKLEQYGDAFLQKIRAFRENATAQPRE